MSIALFPSVVVACVAGVLLAIAAGAFACARAQAKVRRMTDALDHMSQGLCMFDAAGRIVICNRPFCACTTCPPDVVETGLHAARIDRASPPHRIFTGDLEQYCNEIMDGVAAGNISKWIVERRAMAARSCHQRADTGRRLGIDA